jgi:hypothetical protein
MTGTSRNIGEGANLSSQVELYNTHLLLQISVACIPLDMTSVVCPIIPTILAGLCTVVHLHSFESQFHFVCPKFVL